MPKIFFDPRFIEIEYELWALGHLRETLERQIDALRQQDEETTWQELRQAGWEDDEGERQLAQQQLSERQDFVIPRFTRGPFLVSLWACYEAGTKELADYLRRALGAPLGWRDLRASNELAKIRKYYATVLQFSLDDDVQRLALIEDLRIVRNALAHANGRHRWMRDEQWDAVVHALGRHGHETDDDYRGMIVLSREFVATAYDGVNASLRELVKRVRAFGRPPSTETMAM